MLISELGLSSYIGIYSIDCLEQEKILHLKQTKNIHFNQYKMVEQFLDIRKTLRNLIK
jgi:hypothetical protein